MTIEDLFPYETVSESAGLEGIARRTAMTTLVGGADRGDYTLPDSFTTPWTALRRLAAMPVPDVAPDPRLTAAEAVSALRAAALDDAGTPPVGSLAASRASAQDAADWRRYAQMAAQGFYLEAFRSLGPQVITDHIAPALAELIGAFTKDMTVLRHYAGQVAPDLDALLDEPDKVRQAYRRWMRFPVSYATIRNGWLVLRQWDRVPELLDPNGEASLLAEVANAPEVAPDDWQDIKRGAQRGPWGTDHPSARMAWLITRGARIWAPTAAQWNAAYPHKPDPRPAFLRSLAMNGDPRAIIANNLAAGSKAAA